MSIFTRLKEYFTPKIIFVKQSELSDPINCERITYADSYDQEIVVLRHLSIHNWMLARDMDKIYPSGGRRLNELYHKWLVDNIGHKNRFIYKLNDKWYEILLQHENIWQKN